MDVVAPDDNGPRLSGMAAFASRKARIGGGVVVTHGLGYAPKLILLQSDKNKVVTFTSKTTQTVTISAASSGDTITSLIW